MLKFYVEVFYVMGKALSGELSCKRTVLVYLELLFVNDIHCNTLCRCPFYGSAGINGLKLVTIKTVL